jgi:hypothetical protein
MTTPAEQASERELPQFWECPDCGYKMHRDHYDERVSEWAAARTGLPIDFQFQRASEANEFDGRRNGVGATP